MTSQMKKESAEYGKFWQYQEDKKELEECKDRIKVLEQQIYDFERKYKR